MRVIRGFPSEGIVAGYTETPGGGDIEDINAPCNAPAKDPVAYAEYVLFHSNFFIYELAMPLQTVTVTHSSVAVLATSFLPDPSQTGEPLPPLGYTTYGQQVSSNDALVTHGLGYAPLAMVAYNGNILVSGRIVQMSSAGGRFASAYSTASQVGVAWCGYSSDVALPAQSTTYQVLVFRTPTPNPSLPLFSGGPTAFQMGRGLIQSSSRYLRRKTSAESSFDFDLGRTVDLNNGGVRIVTGGDVINDPSYGGSFGGSTYVPVGSS